jgi:hypothetical protein
VTPLTAAMPCLREDRTRATASSSATAASVPPSSATPPWPRQPLVREVVCLRPAAARVQDPHLRPRRRRRDRRPQRFA